MTVAGTIAARHRALIEELRRRLGPGVALEPYRTAQLAAQLGAHFGGVRLHHAPIAARVAHILNSEAVQVGGHILAKQASLEVQHPAGVGLLGHELVHVAIQRAAAAPALDEETLAQHVEMELRQAAEHPPELVVAPDPDAVAERVYQRLVNQIRDERERLAWV